MNIFGKLFNKAVQQKSNKTTSLKGYYGSVYYSDNEEYSVDGEWLNEIVYLFDIDNLSSSYAFSEYSSDRPLLVVKVGSAFSPEEWHEHKMSELKSEQYQVYTLSKLKNIISDQIKEFNESIADTKIRILNNENNIFEMLYRYLKVLRHVNIPLLPEPLFVSSINKTPYTNDPQAKINIKKIPTFNLVEGVEFDDDADYNYKAWEAFEGETSWHDALLKLIQKDKLEIIITGDTGRATLLSKHLTLSDNYYLNYNSALKAVKILPNIPIMGMQKRIKPEVIRFKPIMHKIKIGLTSCLEIYPSKTNIKLMYQWYTLHLRKLNYKQWHRLATDIYIKVNHHDLDKTASYVPEVSELIKNTDFKAEMFNQGLDFTRDEVNHTYLQNRQVEEIKKQAEKKINKIYGAKDDYSLLISQPFYNEY